VTLMTMAQLGIIGRMQTPVDLTYLADTVILLRYFEQRGKVRKAVSVIKKRLGGHENSLRELKVNHAGVRVGAPLVEFQGVLTGVPTFTGHSEHMLADE
jgi:circadian clock protein KaiC